MLWKKDDAVEAARRKPEWVAFHRACGRHNLFFDHIERDGRRAPYRCSAFTTQKQGEHYVHFRVAEGSGKTPIDAVADAYRKAGQPVADGELARLNAEPEDFDLDALLG